MTASLADAGISAELRRYWRGQGPLWKLFWIYGVALSIAAGAVIIGAVVTGALPVPLLLVCLFAALLYTAFILVSIWRSAFNIASDPLGIEREAWGWLARVLTFAWALNAAGVSLMLLQFALNY